MGSKEGNLKMKKMLSATGHSLAVFCAPLGRVFCPSQSGLGSLAEVLIRYCSVILCIPQERSRNRPTTEQPG